MTKAEREAQKAEAVQRRAQQKRQFLASPVEPHLEEALVQRSGVVLPRPIYTTMQLDVAPKAPVEEDEEDLQEETPPPAVAHLGNFERFVVAFSGGKDSIALVLYLLELGVPRSRIELWHHAVDGEGPRFFDWPCTEAYCRKVAKHLGLPIYFSWKDGGFEGEMLRDNQLTRPTSFETPNGLRTVGGQRGKKTTRLAFPQQSADLKVRWCSAYLKIDIAKKVWANDPRFASGVFCMLTGERAEESTARARYSEAVYTASNRRRIVVQWRAIHKWTEADVWGIIRRWGIVPHPAYFLGFSRVSCMSCIFGNHDQWATVRALAPDIFRKIANYEQEFTRIGRERGLSGRGTIHRTLTVTERADAGHVLFPQGLRGLAQLSQQEDLRGYPIHVAPEAWELPAGAFRETGGPI